MKALSILRTIMALHLYLRSKITFTKLPGRCGFWEPAGLENANQKKDSILLEKTAICTSARQIPQIQSMARSKQDLGADGKLTWRWIWKEEWKGHSSEVNGMRTKSLSEKGAVHSSMSNSNLTLNCLHDIPLSSMVSFVTANPPSRASLVAQW